MNKSDDRFLDPTVETMPREDIERLQESRILQLVPYVYQRSPLVRELWDKHGVKPEDIKSLADFKAKVPFMDKDMIRDFRDRHQDPFGGLACAGPPHMRGVGFTSGTTGDPTPLPRAEDNAVLMAVKRELWHIGMRPGDSFTYLLFTFREGQIADRWMDAGYTPICVQHSPLDIPYLVQISRQFRPKALFMISTPIMLGLEQYEKNTGEDIKEAFSSYEGIVFGGEPMSPHIKRLMERWDLTVFELTSLGDIATATECSYHDGMHTWEDIALIEHLDPDGNTDAEDGGRGEMVVTALLDDVAPLIRFRTDDLINFTREPCRCGRTHARMTPLGRKGDELVVQGKSILPIDIFPFIGDFPETRTGLFQIIRPQRECEILKLRVGYDPELLTNSEEELIKRIKTRVSTELAVPSDIVLMSNIEMVKLGPPNKIPRVSKQ